MAWTWTGAGGTDGWTNSQNWSGASGTPSSSGDGTVYITGPATIDLGGNQTITNLYINGGGVSIVGADKLSLNSSLHLAADAVLSFGAGTKIGGSATIYVSGSGTATISGGTFTNSNNDLVVDAGQNLVLSGGASITVSQIGHDSGSSSAGTVTLNGATLNLNCGGSSAPILFDAVTTDGTRNILKVPSYAKTMTLQNLGYGDEIYAGGDTLQLKDNGNGTYSLIDIHGGRYGSTIATSVTLAAGANVNDFTMQNGYFVYAGSPYCFYAGTRIATPSGHVTVETIQPGDLVLTEDGRALPVRWVGRSRIATRFADRLRGLPVRIKAGALAEGLPARDLVLSPDHAVFLDGVLVQAGALVNGVSILREEGVPEIFTYYHVELASHELLLAEGLPAESFVDNVDRMAFTNWDAREAPKAPIREMAYPRAQSARQVPAAIRRTIAARAASFTLPLAA
ncbi:Hint domain-containing protein [Acidocella sp.]|uniref:Hint domain-containing protein n=1 Tax=Acidocella sp. TaxID=50710 RepID=UPI003CFECC32